MIQQHPQGLASDPPPPPEGTPPTVRGPLAPPTNRRLGPRPLPLHLGWLATTWATSSLALASWNAGSLTWKPALGPRAAAWIEAAAAVDRDRLLTAVEHAGRARLGRFMAGVLAYRRHPYRRTVGDVPVLWRQGATQLLVFGDDLAVTAPVLLLVPSLINRAYVLDLSERRSFCRWLASQGVRVLLVDWGTPTDVELGFNLADVVCGPLEGALDAALDAYGGPIGVGGYCMGGLLALGLASRRARDIAHTVMLATPYDFHADAEQACRLQAAVPFLLPWIDRIGFLPTDGLQALFAGLDPSLVITKFVALSRLAADSATAEAFVALEDWINDGVPLAGPVARTCLAEWYGANAVARGGWRIAGRPVRAAALGHIPSLVMVPEGDRIVPPASAKALAAAWPGAQLMPIPLGHIGMITSARARTQVWQPVANWCHARA
ncbi:MAG: alpha/beta hydrolase [Alphaproteobacteria bacterium]|nr:MAG: alpha/beta hydrolase [Alphaproteobacteria bacterium]